MRRLSFAPLAALLLLLPLGASARNTAPQATPIGNAPIACKGQGVNEEGYVKISGIEQWVTIKGEDCRNPVILFVHGGPGNPMTPYANSPYRPWEKEFTFVNWDQRGAGQTYARNPVDPETEEHILSVEGLAADGAEVAAFAARHLNARKLILFGGSWGSALGFDSIRAPQKEYFLLPRTGHDHNPTMVEAQYKVLTSKVLPLLR